MNTDKHRGSLMKYCSAAFGAFVFLLMLPLETAAQTQTEPRKGSRVVAPGTKQQIIKTALTTSGFHRECFKWVARAMTVSARTTKSRRTQ